MEVLVSAALCSCSKGQSDADSRTATNTAWQRLKTCLVHCRFDWHRYREYRDKLQEAQNFYARV